MYKMYMYREAPEYCPKHFPTYLVFILFCYLQS